MGFLRQSVPLGLPPRAKPGAVAEDEARQNRRSSCHGPNRSLNLAKTFHLLGVADGINPPQGKKIGLQAAPSLL